MSHLGQACGTLRSPHLGEQDGQHVLPLEADGQVHQSEAGVKGGRSVEQPYLVCGELPRNVSPRRLVGLHCRQVPLHHAWQAKDSGTSF